MDALALYISDICDIFCLQHDLEYAIHLLSYCRHRFYYKSGRNKSQHISGSCTDSSEGEYRKSGSGVDCDREIVIAYHHLWFENKQNEAKRVLLLSPGRGHMRQDTLASISAYACLSLD